MKKLLLMPLLALLPLMGMAQQKLVIDVPNPGDLPSLIDEDDWLFVKELTVTGSINSTDIGLIRTMAGNGTDGYQTNGILAKLDLSGAKIVKGGDPYYTDASDGETDEILRDNVMGWNMFYSCFALEEVILPEGITEIKDDAFAVCTNLKKVNIPSTVTKIGDGCFMGCASLESIEIPEGVTTLEDFTFSDCRLLQEVKFPSTLQKIERCVFYQNDALEEIEIPEGVTSIGRNTFGHCPNLAAVSLPSTLTALDEGVFLNCDALTTLMVQSVTPPACTEATFEYVGKLENGKPDLSGITLLVSGAGLNLYKADPVWGQCGKIEAYDQDNIDAINAVAAQADAQGTTRYDLNGRRVSADYKGIAIVKNADGTATKVLLK